MLAGSMSMNTSYNTAKPLLSTRVILFINYDVEYWHRKNKARYLTRGGIFTQFEGELLQSMFVLNLQQI